MSSPTTDEEVNDSLLELEEMIVNQYAVDQQEEEKDDNTAEPLPQILPTDALKSLHKLHLLRRSKLMQIRLS
jgi:hypothetical protein